MYAITYFEGERTVHHVSSFEPPKALPGTSFYEDDYFRVVALCGDRVKVKAITVEKPRSIEHWCGRCKDQKRLAEL